MFVYFMSLLVFGWLSALFWPQILQIPSFKLLSPSFSFGFKYVHGNAGVFGSATKSIPVGGFGF